jgi:hypothetical protein
MRFFKQERKEVPEPRQCEGTVKRIGLYESDDGRADHYVMLLEGDATPLHMRVRRNTAFALTSPGDFVRFTLSDPEFESSVLRLTSFQNFTLSLND